MNDLTSLCSVKDSSATTGRKSWSLSSLGTWEQCPLKYKFKYLDKIPDKPSDAASRGTNNHALIEAFLKGEVELLPSALSFYQQFLTGLKLYPIFPEHKIAVNAEWQLVNWNDGWLRCVLDLKLKDGTGVVIYDWKTGKIYDDHNQQKELYAIAASVEDPEATRVRAVHVYLDLNKHTERTYERSELVFSRRKWEARVAKMQADSTFIPNPTWKCRFCAFSRFKGGPCQF